MRTCCDDHLNPAIIQEVTNRQQVINVAVHGQVDEVSLKALAERVRDDLSALPDITQVELANARPYEISIEISETQLRRHGLTFDDVAEAVRRSSLDLPGGSVKTAGGEFLLRTKGQAYRGHEFERLVLLTRTDGTPSSRPASPLRSERTVGLLDDLAELTLGDVATVVDGFEDTDQFSRFEGDPALVVSVYRTGEQSAITVSDAVHAYVETARSRMPEGISLTTLGDQAFVLKDRLSLLVRKGLTGFALVFIVLTLFLRFSLAFWVSLGIPVSFLGALWLLPSFDVSVNMMSLFAFIVVLGILVDDAIIVGENIYTHQQRHGDRLRASIEGTREVATPVIFAVLASAAAFAPMLVVPGVMGKMMIVLPLVVIPCLMFSLIESQLILPAHLSHGKTRAPRDTWGSRMRNRMDGGLKSFVDRVYRPALELGIRWRYLTVAIAVAMLLVTAGLVGGGWVRVVFMPPVDADFLSGSVTMPQGTPVAVTEAAVQHMEDAAQTLRAQVREGTGRELFKYVYGLVGTGAPRLSGGMGPGIQSAPASHLGGIFIELTTADERGIGSAEASNRWRELVGTIPDAVEVKFDAELFMAGDPINVQLTGSDIDELRAAGDAVKARLAEYAGVSDIADSFRDGKQEIKLGITPAAEVLGLSLQDLGRQVRQAFYGEEAQRADARLHGRADAHLFTAGRASQVVRPAAHHHVRHPVRTRRRHLGPSHHGHGHQHALDVRARRPGRRGRQRQPGHGALHQPPSPHCGEPDGRDPRSGRRALPADLADVADDVLWPDTAHAGNQPAGTVPDPDGRLARLRRDLLDLHHADTGAGRLHHDRGREGAVLGRPARCRRRRFRTCPRSGASDGHPGRPRHHGHATRLAHSPACSSEALPVPAAGVSCPHDRGATRSPDSGTPAAATHRRPVMGIRHRCHHGRRGDPA